MIRYSELHRLFDEVDFPVEEFNIEVLQKELGLPYAVYIPIQTLPFAADGISYVKMVRVQLELVHEEIDPALNQKIEQILKKHEIYYEMETDYSEETRVVVSMFEFTVMQDE